MAEKKKPVHSGNKKGDEYKLSVREQKFVAFYLEHGDATKAVIDAKFNTTSPSSYAKRLLAKPKIQKEVARQWDLFMNERIAGAQEILGFQTMVMRGLVKDQFGLEATLKDRLDASKELAKRQIDAKEVADKGKDSQISITLNWGRGNSTEQPNIPNKDDEPLDDEEDVDGEQ